MRFLKILCAYSCTAFFPLHCSLRVPLPTIEYSLLSSSLSLLLSSEFLRVTSSISWAKGTDAVNGRVLLAWPVGVIPRHNKNWRSGREGSQHSGGSRSSGSVVMEWTEIVETKWKTGSLVLFKEEGEGLQLGAGTRRKQWESYTSGFPAVKWAQ